MEADQSSRGEKDEENIVTDERDRESGEEMVSVKRGLRAMLETKKLLKMIK